MQGLYREETAHPEDGASAGGKTDLPETIRNIADRTGHILACDFISRVLKTAAVLSLNSDEVDPEYRQELQASVQFLATVDPVRIRSLFDGRPLSLTVTICSTDR